MQEQIQLIPQGTYHIYNHAVGKENLFHEPRNYYFFLRLYAERIASIAATYAWCLMPNHFHIVLRIRSEDEILEYRKQQIKMKNMQLQTDISEKYPRTSKNKKRPERSARPFGSNNISSGNNEDPSGFENLKGRAHYLSQQFSNFFNAYTKALNKDLDRHGPLFQRPFKRLPIESNYYLMDIIHYIHYNPIHHRFTKKIHDWPYSSYNSILSDKPMQLERQKVLTLFGNKNRFRHIHERVPEPSIADILEYD